MDNDFVLDTVVHNISFDRVISDLGLQITRLGHLSNFQSGRTARKRASKRLRVCVHGGASFI